MRQADPQMVLSRLITVGVALAVILPGLALATSLNPTPHRSLIFVNQQTGFVIGDGSFFRTDDGGLTWSCLTERVPGSDVFSPRDGFFLDPERGWLIDHHRILQTQDGGMSWEDISPSERLLEGCYDNHLAIHFLTPEIGWVAGNGSRESSCEDVSYVLSTRDGGRSWRRIIFDRGTRHDFFYDFQFHDERIGWGVGSTAVYGTEDGGETWLSRALVPDGHQSPRAWPTIHFVDRMCGWAVAHGQVLVSRDGGRTWALDRQLKETGYVRNTFFIDRSIGFVSGDDFLLRTTDGGVSWKMVGTGGVVFRLCFISERIGWSLDSDLTASFEVKKTEDGGTSWHSIYRRPRIRRQALTPPNPALQQSGPSPAPVGTKR